LTRSSSKLETVELYVVEGERTGARASLVSEGATSVGTSLGCDIVLASTIEELAHARIEITHRDGLCHLMVLEGTVSVDQIQAEVGDSVPVSRAARITLGNSVFTLVSNSASSSTNDTHPSRFDKNTTMTRKRLKTLACSSVIGLCLVVAGFASYIVQNQSLIPLEAESLSVQSFLSDTQFNSLDIETQADGIQKLVGRVATRTDQIELKSMLDAAGYAIQVDVSVDEVLVEDVSAVYRLSDVDASVDINGPGEVAVRTTIADDTYLEEVESRAYQDVPELVRLTRINTPPPTTTKDSKPTAFTPLPGKRIKMVVSSDPAFILTEDGSRYFTGAILPSGYKIKSIYEKTVQLERDKEILDLVF